VDGEVKYWNKLERLTRVKRDGGDPVNMMKYPEVADNIGTSDIDYMVLGAPYNAEGSLVEPQHPAEWKSNFSEAELILFGDHHLSHAAHAFYASGLDESYVLVIDRNGSPIPGERPGTSVGCQTETLYKCSYPCKFEVVYSRTGWVGITGLYGLLSERCGIDDLDNGKTMGLSTYGSKEYMLDTINNNIIAENKEEFLSFTGIADMRDSMFLVMDKGASKEDMAYTAQKRSNRDVLRLVSNIDFSSIKSLCITGGHAHNCLTNFNILNLIPKDVQLFVDPIPDDSACSIGYAKYVWYTLSGSLVKHPMTNIFNCGGDYGE
jgi:carbamoyltransferase